MNSAPSGAPPLIALSAKDEDSARPYREALLRAGARPERIELFLASQRPDAARAAAAGAFLFAGGADIDPERYGEAAQKGTNPDLERDRFEFPLFARALEKRAPVLCICRGLQLANVALGGSLYQDLAEVAGISPPHAIPDPEERRKARHRVRGEAGGARHLAAPAPGAETLVNSRHHQGVRRLAPGLRVAARAVPDGVIEAVEFERDYPYFLAVQWHPEDLALAEGREDQLEIFRGFMAGGIF